MKEFIVRLKSIEVKNFKNVEYGKIDFSCSEKSYDASILGLYGQNGSGKTALIDALHLLKLSLSGQYIPTFFADFVNIEAAFATINYQFKIESKSRSEKYDVIYSLSIKRDIDGSQQNTEQGNSTQTKYRTTVFNENIIASYIGPDSKFKQQPIFDSNTEEVFVPNSKYVQMFGNDKQLYSSLLAGKTLCSISSQSFAFSSTFMNALRKSCSDLIYLNLFESLVLYGNYELFVISTSNSAFITMNALPLTFKYEESNHASIGQVMIGLNGPTFIPQNALALIEKLIASMNIVLQQLIPGLTISVKNLGIELRENGEPNTKIQLMSNKNSKEIPLQYESEGIKKIVSVLQLLIVVYNTSSITVAIDELDSGVFEYLLGELLRIISEKGKGQLIFTSHNLRPLETINKNFIAFTTTNPQNRYIRLQNIKKNNNLRDFYYRDIMLGEQSESIYNTTNNYEIALAFREAGDHSGS